MPDIWFYSVAGQEIGPVTLRELKQRLPSFPTAEDVLVWHASFTDWLPAEEVAPLIDDEGLFDAPSPVAIDSERYAATVGRLLGGTVFVIGCVMLYLGITGQEQWLAHLFDLSDGWIAAVPGVLMCVTGLSVIWGTRKR
jgi:GYF domain 2